MNHHVGNHLGKYISVVLMHSKINERGTEYLWIREAVGCSRSDFRICDNSDRKRNFKKSFRENLKKNNNHRTLLIKSENKNWPRSWSVGERDFVMVKLL